MSQVPTSAFSARRHFSLVVALGDHLTVADEALAAYERALKPKKLVMLSGGHFDAYVKDFELASAPARDWFVTHLKNR